MRKPRQYSDLGLYHIVVRGVNKQNIFFDDEDKSLFINLIKKYSKKMNIQIHAFCLMDNHVHLELGDPEKKISLFMQCVCSIYARLFNKKYDRIGHLFQERYASEIISTDTQFLTVFRYILQNPQKAGLCKIENYKWSSYRLYSYTNTFIYRNKILEYFIKIKDVYDFVQKETNEICLEIELRPSEREIHYIERIKQILNTDNPLIKPDLPIEIIKNKVRKLKQSGFSIQTIVRTTGVSKYYVQTA